MEISEGAILQTEDGGYPFEDLSRLRNDAGAFMQRALSEDEDMDEEPVVITPDYPLFESAHASSPPTYHRPIAVQPQQAPLEQQMIPSAKGNVFCDRIVL